MFNEPYLLCRTGCYYNFISPYDWSTFNNSLGILDRQEGEGRRGRRREEGERRGGGRKGKGEREGSYLLQEENTGMVCTWVRQEEQVEA